MKKLDEEITGHTIEELYPAQLKKFIKKKIKKIARILSTHPNDEHIHEMRKLIKAIMYITEFAEKKWSGAYTIIDAVPHEQLNKLSALIGDFHDSSILLCELSSFSSTGILQAERNAIARYVEDAMARHKIIRKYLLPQIENFVGNLAQNLQ